MDYNRIQEYIIKLQNQLDSHRYVHTIGVMYTAASMAMRYHENLEKAMLAGLLHDCAKGYSNKRKLELCRQYSLPIADAEEKNPGLLHAKLGAYIAKTEYHIQDTSILDAICYHTTGRPNMTLLDKIIYIADYIEPHRCEAPNLEEVRQLAFQDIDQCLARILKDSLEYLDMREEIVDPMTEQTYNYYKEYLKEV